MVLPKPIGESANHAKRAYEHIINSVKSSTPPEGHHVVIVVEGPSGPVYVTDIGYANPDLLFFNGLVDPDGDGLAPRKTEIIQHVSQLNFSLIYLPDAPDIPAPKAKAKIGFLGDRLEEDSNNE